MSFLTIIGLLFIVGNIMKNEKQAKINEENRKN